MPAAALAVLEQTPNAAFIADEFFKASISNEHTKRAYGRIVGQFLTWCGDRKVWRSCARKQRREPGRLLLFQPWVYQSDAEGVEVFHVAGNDSEAVLKGRRCDHAVWRAQGLSGQLAHSVQPAPSRCNRLRYRKNTPRKQHSQVTLQRSLQARPPRGVPHGRESRFQFADADDAQKQRTHILGINPTLHF